MPTIELSRKELALKLYMQGVATSCIAERFGITRPSVNKMISDARKDKLELFRTNIIVKDEDDY